MRNISLKFEKLLILSVWWCGVGGGGRCCTQLYHIKLNFGYVNAINHGLLGPDRFMSYRTPLLDLVLFLCLQQIVFCDLGS